MLRVRGYTSNALIPQINYEGKLIMPLIQTEPTDQLNPLTEPLPKHPETCPQCGQGHAPPAVKLQTIYPTSIPFVKNSFWQRLKSLWRLSAYTRVDEKGNITITPSNCFIRADEKFVVYTTFGDIDIATYRYNGDGKIYLNSHGKN